MEHSTEKPNVKSPGWNDPPVLTYDPSLSSGIASGPKLNKRVAFPMNKADITSNSLLSPTVLPGCPPSISSPSISVVEKSTPESDGFEDSHDEDVIKQVKLNFQEVEEKCLKSEAGINDAVKRIDVMISMWLDGKFSKELKIDVFNLSEELVKGNLEEADALHKKMIMNNFSQCSSWIPGIRHLIHICRKGKTHSLKQLSND